MELICNEEGKWEQHDPYASVDFKTEEDYKAFEKMLSDRNKFRWRNTKDELPLGQLVLVQVSGHPLPNVTLDNAFCLAEYYADEGWWCIEGFEEWENPDVIAWMLLPEPYKPD